MEEPVGRPRHDGRCEGPSPDAATESKPAADPRSLGDAAGCLDEEVGGREAVAAARRDRKPREESRPGWAGQPLEPADAVC